DRGRSESRVTGESPSPFAASNRLQALVPSGGFVWVPRPRLTQPWHTHARPAFWRIRLHYGRVSARPLGSVARRSLGFYNEPAYRAEFDHARRDGTFLKGRQIKSWPIST